MPVLVGDEIFVPGRQLSFWENPSSPRPVFKVLGRLNFHPHACSEQIIGITLFDHDRVVGSHGQGIGRKCGRIDGCGTPAGGILLRVDHHYVGEHQKEDNRFFHF